MMMSYVGSSVEPYVSREFKIENVPRFYSFSISIEKRKKLYQLILIPNI